MKKLLILLLILLVAGVVGVAMFAGTAIEKGVETGGTWAFGTDTELGGASLSVIGGSVGLNELTVANPAGFTEGNAIRVGDLGVQTDVGSLLSDVIEVEFIEILSPELTLELGTGGTNLGALLDHLDQRAKSLPKGEPGPEPEPEPAPDDGKPGKKLHVGRVTIDGAKVHLKQSVLLSGGTTVTLPKIELTDIGGGGTGGKEAVTLPELFEQILGTILAAASKTGALPKDLEGLLNQELAKEALANVKKTVDQMSGELKKSAEGLKDELENQGKKAVDDLKEGLGGLLGGKDEKSGKKD